MTNKQKAINQLKSAVKAIEKAGLSCFCTGSSICIFDGEMPYDGEGVDQSKMLESIDICGWDAGDF